MEPCRHRVLALSVVLALSPIELHAEEAAPEAKLPRPYAIDYSASLRETITDNGNLSSTNAHTDLISEPAISVRASSNSARLKGFFDYTLKGLLYSRDSSRDRLQNDLKAAGTAALVENRVFVDVAGSISQQALSPFGIQAPDSALANTNRVEVATFTVSPYVRGRLAGLIDYEARLGYSVTRGDVSSASDNDASNAVLQLGGATRLAPLSWTAQLTHNEVDYSLGRRTEADMARGVLSWTVDPQLSLSAIGGAESNNYVSQDKESHSIAGAGLKWRPSERTSLSAQVEHRFFGESHGVSFVHRAAHTVWGFNDARDISTGAGQPVTESLGNAFDLVFEQFTPVEPDPVIRRQLVNSFLQARGIDPASQLFAAFPTSAVTLLRSRTFSVAWIAPRDTLTFIASDSDSRRLDTVVLPTNDFLSTSFIRQRGVSLNLSHLLTPLSSLSINAAYQRSSGSLDSLTTSLRSLTAQYARQFGRSTDFSLGARHAIFRSTTSPYDETAVFATARVRF